MASNVLVTEVKKTKTIYKTNHLPIVNAGTVEFCAERKKSPY